MRLQFTIETRALSNVHTESRNSIVEATDLDEAIREYAQQNEAELMSCSRPARGRESIATMRKEDSLFLVRVYSS